MPLATSEPEAYMDAFMNGFEFVLLAMRGRLAEGELPDEERAHVEAFLADYARIASAYRDRKEGRATLSVKGPLTLDVEALATN